MGGAGDWICGVVYRGVWKRGVVYGLGEEAGIWAVCDLSDCAGDISVVFRVAVGWVGEEIHHRVAKDGERPKPFGTTSNIRNLRQLLG